MLVKVLGSVTPGQGMVVAWTARGNHNESIMEKENRNIILLVSGSYWVACKTNYERIKSLIPIIPRTKTGVKGTGTISSWNALMLKI
jgi:hypothetical protein